MTSITQESPSSAGRLEELVDRMLAALFPPEPAKAPVSGLARTVHEARRLRQAGHLDGALEALADVDTTGAPQDQLRWLYGEWLDIARRRFTGSDAMLYSPSTGKAAVLLERDDGALETAAVVGMRWPVGRPVSKRSLRGLKPLAKGGA